MGLRQQQVETSQEAADALAAELVAWDATIRSLGVSSSAAKVIDVFLTREVGGSVLGCTETDLFN